MASRQRLQSIALYAALAPWAFLATPAWAITLEEALARAYETNPTLQASRAELRATDEQIAQAKSLRRPTIDVTGEAGVRAVDNDFNSGTDGTGTVALNLKSAHLSRRQH